MAVKIRGHHLPYYWAHLADTSNNLSKKYAKLTQKYREAFKRLHSDPCQSVIIVSKEPDIICDASNEAGFLCPDRVPECFNKNVAKSDLDTESAEDIGLKVGVQCTVKELEKALFAYEARTSKLSERISVLNEVDAMIVFYEGLLAVVEREDSKPSNFLTVQPSPEE